MVKITLTSGSESNLLGKEIWKISCKNSRNIYEVNRDGCEHFSSKSLIHREVFRLFKGKIPKKFVVHHIDYNSLNNTS